MIHVARLWLPPLKRLSFGQFAEGVMFVRGEWSSKNGVSASVGWRIETIVLRSGWDGRWKELIRSVAG